MYFDEMYIYIYILWQQHTISLRNGEKGLESFVFFDMYFFVLFTFSVKICNEKKNEKEINSDPNRQRRMMAQSNKRNAPSLQALTQTMRRHMFSINSAIQSIFCSIIFIIWWENHQTQLHNSVYFFINFDSIWNLLRDAYVAIKVIRNKNCFLFGNI